MGELDPTSVDRLREQAERRYMEMGFVPVHVVDEANKVYESHSHHEVYLFGLVGLSEITIEDKTRDLIRGIEIHIGEGEEHSAKVGPFGAEYIFAHPADIEPFSYEP